MGIIELILIAIGLAMDAFAVSIGKGLTVPKIQPKHALCVGLWFGGFQALMPIVGYFVGVAFASFVQNIDHWIAFGLLAIIGANMIREALGDDDDDDTSASFAPKAMLLLAIATSIDALAVGVSMAFLNTNIWMAASVIGLITCVISAIGLKIGNIFGTRYNKPAEVFGGIVLIAIGFKILIEHLFFS